MSFTESSLPLDNFPLARGGVLKDAQITYRVHGEIEDGTGAAEVSQAAKWDFTFVQKSKLDGL
jgi:hypothetical protein